MQAAEKRPDPQGRVRCGFVGSLVWYKGGESLVRAMGLLEDSNCVLNVHGSWNPDSDEHHRELQDELSEEQTAIFTQGTNIGEHTVVGAGAVVVQDVPSCKLAYGVPAEIVRDRQKGDKYL